MIDRRGFLRFGTVAVATSAVMAACGGGGEEAATTETTEKSKESKADATVLRTATSLELLAVDVYEAAAKANLLSGPMGSVLKLFTNHHRDHVVLLQSETTKAGGQPTHNPNSAVAQALAGRIAAMKSEADAVALVYDIEKAIAATYQAAVGTFENAELNQTVMSVCGSEARHAAVLAKALNRPQVTTAFSQTTGAVAPGTGITAN